MKKIYFTLVLAFSLIFSIAKATVITATANNGDWATASTWDLNRTPQSGDTVVIPIGYTVILNSPLTYDPMYVKIYGTLTLDQSAKLNLGATSAIMVYAGGKINSTNGSPSEKIRIGGTEVYRGSDPAVNGPVLLNNSGNHPVSAIPLPVKFISFSLARSEKNVLVEWSTASELNCSYFEIDRSTDGIKWTAAGTVIAAGNSTTIQQYKYNDKNVSGQIIYYRVKEVDFDNKVTFTEVKSIHFDSNTTDVRIMATSSDNVVVNFSKQVKSNVSIKMISVSGQLISQQSFSNPVGQVSIPATTSTKGIYIITVTNGQDLLVSRRILL